MPAGSLVSQRALLGAIHRAELALARGEHARAAEALLRGRSHALGNSMQVVQLGVLQLEQRLTALDEEERELLRDLLGAANDAKRVLDELFAATYPTPSTAASQLAPAVRDTCVLAGAALELTIEPAIDLADDVCAAATADDLAAMVAVCLIAASDAGATRVALTVRVHDIHHLAWARLVCIDDRRDDRTPVAVPALVAALAERASGEARATRGRDGFELVVELPTIDAPLAVRS